MSYDPNLTVNSFVSDNADTSIALNGDKITLNFSSSQDVTTPDTNHVRLKIGTQWNTAEHNGTPWNTLERGFVVMRTCF